MKKVRKNKLFIYLVDEIIKKKLFRILPDKMFVFIEYFVMTRNTVKLTNPVSFTEKIQWLKLFGHLERYTRFVDKYEVRRFIKKTIGAAYLVPLLGCWTDISQIEFNDLPDQFVLKGTHGSAYVAVCKDKATLNITEAKKLANSWLNENFYNKTREIQYKNCTPRIICEPYLEEKSGRLTDYKIFCYQGKPEIIEVVWGRYTDSKVDVYKDLNWNTLNIAYKGFPVSEESIEKPSNLDKMLEIATKLSQNFPFVRVDLYSIDGKIYFGELTFTPASGLERFEPYESDILLGKDLDISLYSLNNNKYKV